MFISISHSNCSIPRLAETNWQGNIIIEFLISDHHIFIVDILLLYCESIQPHFCHRYTHPLSSVNSHSLTATQPAQNWVSLTGLRKTPSLTVERLLFISSIQTFDTYCALLYLKAVNLNEQQSSKSWELNRDGEKRIWKLFEALFLNSDDPESKMFFHYQPVPCISC